ncbi:MAG: hypothetical protein LBC84_07200 [Prevotellaceae bacterium]|jgi:hypothetical protein|nr:hypothetical protein [Prevotellaceae bacterium]
MKKIISTLCVLSVIATSCNKTLEVRILYSLSASQTSISLADNQTTTQTIIVTTDANSWDATTDAIWLTIKKEDNILTITPVANPETTERTATVTITAATAPPVTVTVIQAGRSFEQFGNNLTASSVYGGGTGKEDDPYLIYTAQQLKKFVYDVNSGKSYADTYFKLMTHIHVTADEWVPIGNGTNAYFNGNFNGNNHIISGTLKSSDYRFFGFFGVLGSGSVSFTISNLIIEANIINESNFSTDNFVDSYTGAICGFSGYAANSYVVISDCVITGTVTGGNSGSSSTGGVAGSNNTRIQNCVVSGHVNGGKCLGDFGAYTGGITGIHSGEIDNCEVLSSASVTGGDTDYFSHTGGIAGMSNGMITNCTNRAAVTGRHTVGGIVAQNGFVMGGEVHTSLNTGDVSGGNNSTGGLIGVNNNTATTHIYSCSTNLGKVNGDSAKESNQVGIGKGVEACPDEHTKR